MTIELSNIIYKIEAECLTPLVVGSGNEIMPWEYVIFDEGDKRILYRFDLFRFYKILSDEDKKEFGEILNNTIDMNKNEVLGIRKFVNRKKDDYKEKIEEIKIYQEEVEGHYYGKYKKNIDKTVQNKESNQLTISEFMRSKGRAYVPGSSLKGSIRTALLYGKSNAEIKAIEESIKDSPFKKVIVNDSNFMDDIKADFIYRNNNVAVEYYFGKFNFDILFKMSEDESDDLIKKLKERSKKFIENRLNKFEENLEYYNKKLSEEKNTSNNKKQEKNDKLKNSLLERSEELKELEDNEFILSLGFGAGNLYKNLDENKRFSPDDENMKKIVPFLDIPYTHWTLDGYPLGFIKCKITKK